MTDVLISNQMTHTRSCPRLARPADDCTCGLEFRIALGTEQTMHAAWRKRAEEAERERDELRNCLDGGYDCAGERMRLRAALMRSADTFADFNRGLRLLNRPLLADACEIAEKDARAALSAERPADETKVSLPPLPNNNCAECDACWELWHDQACTANESRPNEYGGAAVKASDGL